MSSGQRDARLAVGCSTAVIVLCAVTFGGIAWNRKRQLDDFYQGIGSRLSRGDVIEHHCTTAPGTKTRFAFFRAGDSVDKSRLLYGPLPESARNIIDEVASRMRLDEEVLPDLNGFLLYEPDHLHPQSWLFVIDPKSRLGWAFESDWRETW